MNFNEEQLMKMIIFEEMWLILEKKADTIFIEVRNNADTRTPKLNWELR